MCHVHFTIDKSSKAHLESLNLCRLNGDGTFIEIILFVRCDVKKWIFLRICVVPKEINGIIVVQEYITREKIS